MPIIVYTQKNFKVTLPFASYFWYTTPIMLKRTLLTVLFCFVLSARVVAAQTTPTTPPAVDPSTIQENPYNYRITQDEYAQYRKATQNCDTPSLECLVKYTTRFAAMEWALDIAYGQKVADSGERSGGVFAGVMGLIKGMYNYPAAHTATYVADVVNNSGLAPKAYAQGLGFASLDPILNLWKVFRNVAYFFFIIIFIFLGFMIMLRKRISGQTAVTVQQAIPAVIISLVLVTFSYAIAGFMIDLMYVLMFLIVGLFEGINSGISVGSENLTGGTLVNLNFISLIAFLFKANMSGEALGTNINLANTIIEAAADGSGIGTYLGGILGGLTLTLVITIAVLIGAVRLFFELLKSYATIILYVVASPIILMFGALPGNDVFWKWLKGIIGNLLAFPTVLLMLIIFIEFTRGNYSGGATGGFMPPFLIGNGSAANMIGPLLGLAIILGLPDIVKEVKKAAGAGDGGVLGTLINAAVKNAAQPTDVAIPALAGSTWGLGKGAVGLGAHLSDRKTKKDPESLWNAFTGGYKIIDGNNKVIGTRGGLVPGFQTGLGAGQKARKTIDDIRDRRFLQPDNIRTLLERLDANKPGTKTK